MKVGAANRVVKRPVAVVTINRIRRLDDRREGDLPLRIFGLGRECVGVDEGFEFEPAGVKPGGDAGRQAVGQRFIALPVLRKRVVRPLSGRGKVELPVRRFTAYTDKGFEAGVFPQQVSVLGGVFGWNE